MDALKCVPLNFALVPSRFSSFPRSLRPSPFVLLLITKQTMDPSCSPIAFAFCAWIFSCIPFCRQPCYCAPTTPTFALSPSSLMSRIHHHKFSTGFLLLRGIPLIGELKFRIPTRAYLPTTTIVTLSLPFLVQNNPDSLWVGLEFHGCHRNVESGSFLIR